MAESLVWHGDKNINIFSLLKNNTKTTQSMQTHWMMGANADQYDWSTTIISRNCPFFPKILTEETAPNMGIQLQHIWWNHPLFFFIFNRTSCITHTTIWTIQQYLYLPNSLQVLQHHIDISWKEREESIPSTSDHVLYCQETAEKYIRCCNRSVHFPCVCCIPTNSIKVSTTT